MNQKKKEAQTKTNEELEEEKIDLLDKCNQIFAKIRQDFNMKFPTDQYLKFDRQYANHMKKEFDLFALCIEEVSQTYDIDGEKLISSFLNNILITMKVMLFTQIRCFLNYLDQTIQYNDSKSLKNWESSQIQQMSRHKVKIVRGTVDEDVIKAQQNNLISDPSDEVKKRLGVSLDPLLREYSMTKQQLIEVLEEKRRNLTLKESKAGRYLYRQIEGIKKIVQKEKAFVTDFEEKSLQAIKQLAFSDSVTQVKGILDTITENLDQNAKKRLIRVLEYLFLNMKNVFAKKNASVQTQIVGQTIDGYESQITKLNKSVYEADRNIEQVLKETLHKDQKITELEKQIKFLKQAKDGKDENPEHLLMQKIEEQNKQIERLNNIIIDLNVDKKSLANQIITIKQEVQTNQATGADSNSNKKGGIKQKGKNQKQAAQQQNKNSKTNIKSNQQFSQSEFQLDMTNEQQNDIEVDENQYNPSQKLITSQTNILSPSGAEQKQFNLPISPQGYSSSNKLKSNESRESFIKKDSEFIQSFNNNLNINSSNTFTFQGKPQIQQGIQSEIKSTQITDLGSPDKSNKQNNANVLSSNQQSQFNSFQQSGFEQNQIQSNVADIQNKDLKNQKNSQAAHLNIQINSEHEQNDAKHKNSKNNKSYKQQIQNSENDQKEEKNLHNTKNKGKISKKNSIEIEHGVDHDKQTNQKTKKNIKNVKSSSKNASISSLHEVNSLSQLNEQQAEAQIREISQDKNQKNKLISSGGENSSNHQNLKANSNQNNKQDQLDSSNLANNNMNQNSTNNVQMNQANHNSNTAQYNQIKSQVHSSKNLNLQQEKEAQVQLIGQIKSENDLNSQVYLESIQAQSQNQIKNSSKQNQMRGSQNSLFPTRDTDLTSIQTIPQNFQNGLEEHEQGNHQERLKSKFDLNDILDALDLNQEEEEEKKHSTKILEVLTNKENPKRREIINTIVAVLNQQDQHKNENQELQQNHAKQQKYSEKISTYTGFTSSDQGQTQYKKTQNSINSSPYSTQQNLRYTNAQDKKKQQDSQLNNNQQKSTRFQDIDKTNKKYFKSENNSLHASAKEIELKDSTLEKIDQNLNESSLNTSIQGKYQSQSQSEINQQYKQKKYATQVSFKDLQVKPVDQEHLQKLIEKQEVLQDIFKKKNQISMSRLQGDTLQASNRDGSQNNQQMPIEKNQKRNLSNIDQKRGQYLNQWKSTKDEFRIHDPHQVLQQKPVYTTSHSTQNLGADYPKKNIPKFIPNQNNIKVTKPFNEEQQFTQDLYEHFQKGQINFSKLQELDLSAKQIKSQTNLNTIESSGSALQNKLNTTGKYDANNIGFYDFQEYYSELIQQHRRCGPMCIHLKRFYEKLNFNYKPYEKRQMIICPTLIVQEVPKETRRDPTRFNIQSQTMYQGSSTKI
ncbi:hypothetical protein TTHERM_00138550 (macronuclear) [Tetrahymena thermophila SB210]|uniref:Uncharacterized protein n=1 Tax=Tetrahymena thermophila (strain SB210) TaxID=312017 RepID=I7M8S8_TETTS|nr:hypothetical protein TTHERM_00138550 [Tetrahymena thermophila SB210]EAR99592.1 hypothetical protein TTHERM_00138550 [Tetrahymena thermophila SB210]|eukprot:XP_001019837.1 hypothetical protein TTHERM_00138550 [Tetrahymena thermophila SB210]